MCVSPPRHVAVLAALWPYVTPQRVEATAAVARLLPAARGRCGLYVLTFTDGHLYVGRSGDVVARFAAHRRADADLVEMHFWRFAKAGLDSAERSAVHALREAGFTVRNHAGELDDLLGAAEQQRWLASAPADEPGDGVRPQRPRTRAGRPVTDPRVAAVLPAVRRYLARTVPAPRRTEHARWTVTAGARERLLTVTVHAMETLFVAVEADRTVLTVNLDRATIERYQGALDRFGAAFFRTASYRVRPGVVAVSVEGARNLMRLLDVPGVVEAARRLNLDLMRTGPALHRRGHAFELADLLLDPAAEAATDDPFTAGLACDAAGDIPRAEAFFARAAAAGNPEAAFRLGELWAERGDGDQAEPWYRQAAAGG
ncbi:hypothetical protein AB0F81_51165, partial [Actinoplanes sp. NPDC024001]|uniref:hypothetical protein n=1 Tax=Actinoplanes sp. NPDC024001 TaxID=3154598 RepID=UPI0033E1FB2F